MKIFGFYITKVDWATRYLELKNEYMQEKTRKIRVLGVLNTMILTKQLYYWKNTPVMIDRNLKVLLEDLRDYLRKDNYFL